MRARCCSLRNIAMCWKTAASRSKATAGVCRAIRASLPRISERPNRDHHRHAFALGNPARLSAADRAGAGAAAGDLELVAELRDRDTDGGLFPRQRRARHARFRVRQIPAAGGDAEPSRLCLRHRARAPGRHPRPLDPRRSAPGRGGAQRAAPLHRPAGRFPRLCGLGLAFVAASYPELEIVAARPGWPWQAETIAVLMHKRNIWYELHGWSPKYYSPDLKHEIPRRLKHRILFGADYPLFTYERLVRDWRAEGYSEEVLEQVFHRNAEAFLQSLGL